MPSYLCASGHHFSAPAPRCPYPACTAEIRPTAMHPSTDGDVPTFKHLPKLPDAPLSVPESSSSPSPGTKHAIRWWAYAADGSRVRRTSDMKDKFFKWDATCAPCGWDSDTGGDTMTNVDKLVQEHKR